MPTPLRDHEYLKHPPKKSQEPLPVKSWIKEFNKKEEKKIKMGKGNSGRVQNVFDLLCILYGSLAVICGIVIIIVSIWG